MMLNERRLTGSGTWDADKWRRSSQLLLLVLMVLAVAANAVFTYKAYEQAKRMVRTVQMGETKK